MTNGHNAYPENTKPFYSALRQANYGGTGNVIPDAVADVSLVDLGTGAVKPLPQHFFIEVKAYNAPTHVFGLFGGLTLDTSNGQIQGLLDAAWRGEVGSGILFLTTSDTEINNRVLWWATSHGVTVWQAKAFAVPDPSDPSRYMIGFGPAELQNPSVLGVLQENNIVPIPPNPLPNGTAPDFLGRTLKGRATPVFQNPDPTFQPSQP